MDSTNRSHNLSLEGLWFKLREIEPIKSSSNRWELRLQFIESHMLLFVASGQGSPTIDGQFIELRQGCAYVCKPGQLVEAAVHSFDERGLYYLRFDVIKVVISSLDYAQNVNRDSPLPIEREVIKLFL